MLPQHFTAVAKGEIPSALLPHPDSCLRCPRRVFSQLVVGVHTGAVNDVQVAHGERPLLQDIENLEAAITVIPCRQAKIETVPVGVAFVLWTVQESLHALKAKGE